MFFLKLHRLNDGRLAQLVQSVCLTSRGSAVRIRQRPPGVFPVILSGVAGIFYVLTFLYA